MSNADNSGRASPDASFTDAPLAAVLLYGLTLGDEDPALGVVLGARRELGLITSLLEHTTPGMEPNIAELVPVFESIGRRLDVAVELIVRAQRAGVTSEALEELKARTS